MYGYKFFVFCLDIFLDGVFFVSGFVDKNVKFWGMDFGDLYKFFFVYVD